MHLVFNPFLNWSFLKLCARVLCVLQLNEMISHPVEGHFWQVDHIKPVYSGGGQCLLDNLQTLCTVCHRMVQHSAASRHFLFHKLA